MNHGMKNKCVRCGGEASEWSVVCFGCRQKEERNTIILGQKEERNTIILGGVVLFAVFAIIFGCRLLWAHFVFNDLRCAISECRILK